MQRDNSEPLPHDGWRSRKVILGIGTFVLVYGSCVLALVIGKADFDQVADVIKWITPAVMLPLMTGLGLYKIAEANRR